MPNKFPIGVLKFTPVDDDDDTATKMEIDLSYFVEDTSNLTYVCKVNGKSYTKEQMLKFEIAQSGKVWVLRHDAKLLLKHGIAEMYPIY
jgi:hypothetical protein